MRYLSLVLFLYCALPQASVETNILCLNPVDAGFENLEFRRYHDRTIGWEGGAARYQSAANAMPLILGDRRIDVLDPARPYQVTETWLEVGAGKLIGKYELMSQGAVVYSFAYTQLSNGKTVDFLQAQQYEPQPDARCDWSWRRLNGVSAAG
ncbi:hypothetical protein QTN24_05650 [Cupriavidus sp. SZY C1]|uniref:hypothetical protein n=1 Tax=Cupriavidus sp. SZY C1 TaxID=3055037 RepID=UPI0028B7B716|nr:hypothetical protein [Cupriavidus sp. SZY C1]MDT6960971.1 hypothetical protein [Cupriavidus sp. SZY C1]